MRTGRQGGEREKFWVLFEQNWNAQYSFEAWNVWKCVKKLFRAKERRNKNNNNKNDNKAKKKRERDLPFTVDANRMEGKHSKIMRTSNMFTICSFNNFSTI